MLTSIFQIMNQHGIYPTVAELTEMIQQVDRNSNGTIDYQEFLQMMLDISKVNSQEEDDIQQAFRVFDKVIQLVHEDNNKDSWPGRRWTHHC